MLLFAAIFTQDCLSHGLKDVGVVLYGENRYTGYRKSPPSPGQVKPLDAPIGHISPESLTVGRAMKDLLAGTSYILAQGFTADPEIDVLLDARLPQQQRSLKNLSIQDALSIIAGDPWLIVIDPVNRMVSFELPFPYQDDLIVAEYKTHNGLQLLGLDDVEGVHPISLSNRCKTINRDMTVEWSKRIYWCYPRAYSKRDLCHD